MGRRDYKHTRRPSADAPAAKPRKGGGVAAGLLAGVLLGMAIAGGMYWYLQTQPSGLKPTGTNPPPGPDAGSAPSVMPAPEPARALPAPEPVTEPTTAPVAAPDYGLTAGHPEHRAKAGPEGPTSPVKPAPARPEAAASTRPHAPAKPAATGTDYSFYDILPGNQAPKPKPAAKGVAQLWLQVAALRTAADAERLKARLTLLGLPVHVQRIDNAGAVLHRVRVGPFADEDAGIDALDTLAENDFEPRWVKDPVKP